LNGCVVLFGITRGQASKCQKQFDSLVLQSLQKNSIKYTTYLHAFELNFINASRSQENNIKIKDPKDWQLFKPNFSITECQDKFDKDTDFNKFIGGRQDAWRTGHQNTKNLIRQLFSLQKSFSLIKEKYDFYLFSRLDLLYKNNHGLIDSIKDVVDHPQENILYTPSWNCGAGRALNDRIAICNHNVAEIYANRINYISTTLQPKAPIHSEFFLKTVMDNHNIENKKFRFYAARIRANGRIEKN